MWPVPESSGGSLVKKPHSGSRGESNLSGGKSSGGGTSVLYHNKCSCQKGAVAQS